MISSKQDWIISITYLLGDEELGEEMLVETLPATNLGLDLGYISRG